MKNDQICLLHSPHLSFISDIAIWFAGVVVAAVLFGTVFGFLKSACRFQAQHTYDLHLHGNFAPLSIALYAKDPIRARLDLLSADFERRAGELLRGNVEIVASYFPAPGQTVKQCYSRVRKMLDNLDCSTVCPGAGKCDAAASFLPSIVRDFPPLFLLPAGRASGRL